jgi:hypothetical protein
MLAEAGASIASMASSEIYSAMQSKVLDAANTSSSSFVSYRIYEQVSCYTPAGDNALWFMYQPLLVNKTTFEDLTVAQQEALRAAAKKGAGLLSRGGQEAGRRVGAGLRGSGGQDRQYERQGLRRLARDRAEIVLCGVQGVDAGRPEAARHGPRGRVIAA